MVRNVVFASIALVTISNIAAMVLATEPPATFRMDPVELVEGREVAGKESIYAGHYIYRYLFANEANKAEFLAHPEKHEIQLGGGCGRMGPLSGLGAPDRYAVHEGKIYIFASDGCRKGFLSAPDKMLDPDDPKPDARPNALERGQRLIDHALAGLGGAEKVDAVRTYQRTIATERERDGNTIKTTQRLTLALPDGVRSDYRAGDYVSFSVATPAAAYFDENGQRRPMHAQQRRAMRRDYLHRNVLAILQSRTRPDCAAAHIGKGTVTIGGEEVRVEYVDVWVDNTLNRLGIDPQTGRILSLAYRGHGPNVTYEPIEKVFSDFRDVDGLTLPFASTLWVDGESSGETTTLTSVTINQPEHAKFFEP
jgi:YHS domain-containing protein